MRNSTNIEIGLARENGLLRSRYEKQRIWTIFFAILMILFCAQIFLNSYFGFNIFAGGYCPVADEPNCGN